MNPSRTLVSVLGMLSVVAAALLVLGQEGARRTEAAHAPAAPRANQIRASRPVTSPTMTPTLTATVTATASASPTLTVTPAFTTTATVTATTTATEAPGSRPIYLPYLATRHDLTPPGPRTWGLQFSLEQVRERFDANMAVEVPRAHAAGVRSARSEIRWDRVEPVNATPEEFDWSSADDRMAGYAAAGFDVVVPIVAYPAWATVYQCGYGLHAGMDVEWREFMRTVVQRYSGPEYNVVAWEIGNEIDGNTLVNKDDRGRPPDLGGNQPTYPGGGCWGDRPAEYIDFLRMAYEEVKAVDPGALVTNGGLAAVSHPDFHPEFLEQFLVAGGGAYTDALNYHWFPDFPVDLQGTGPDKLDWIIDSLHRHGLDMPVWLTETYRLTFQGEPESEAYQIEYLTQQITPLLARPELERVYWYFWRDWPTELMDRTERGLVRHDHTPKAGMMVLPYTVAYTNGVPEDISTAAVVAYRFTWPRTPTRVIAWSRDGRPAPFDLPAATGAVARVTTFPADMLLSGQCCAEREVRAEVGRLRFVAGRDALFIELAP